jgi:tRNA(Ile)-lysidine synthase
VRHAIQQYHLILPGETVVVGVSGGPDSLCLLHVLQRLSPDLSINLHVAHLNHRIRGAEADADAAFVANLASEWNLPASIDAVDVPALARAHKLAPEEAARRARYAFLSRVAARLGAHTVAVGHHADDQVETVLMHFLRGSGLAGLRGMLPATPMEELRLEVGGWRLENRDWRSSVDALDSNLQASTSNLQSLTLIRPLLDITRADIEAYCQEHGLQPRFDRSNLDTTYFRNRLRHELVPHLETYNPNIRQVVRRMAMVIGSDYEILRQKLDITLKEITRSESDRAVTFDLVAWRSLPLSLRRSTLREAIHRLRRALRNIDFVHIEKAVEILETGETGDQATLPQGLMLTIGYATFTVADEAYHLLPELPLLMTDEPVPLVLPGATRLPGSAWVLEAEVSSRHAIPGGQWVGTGGWEAYLDAAVVGTSPCLRRRRPGDRFCPFGMGGRSKRVNEFMINEKIPAAWRDHVPLLVNTDDEILWLCGWRPDERTRVTETTGQVVYFQFSRDRAAE